MARQALAFEKRIRIEDRGYATPCEIWTGAISSEGVGSVSVNGHVRVAHRVRWERERGSVADGLELDHLCRQRDCVNLDHLEPVTHRENMRRGSQAKLTPALVRAIRVASGSGVAIAAEFGISQALVSGVRSRKSWTDV